MSAIQNKKNSVEKEEIKQKISEEDEEMLTESENRKEEENNLEEEYAMSAIDDSFSESFYKGILEDSEIEEEKNIKDKSTKKNIKIEKQSSYLF